MDKLYIAYPDSASSVVTEGGIVVNRYISEMGQVSLQVVDFVVGAFRALHHHHTWEITMVDSNSEGPGYIFFDRYWWRVDVGAVVFIPKGYAHAWSAGNNNGFKMLCIYGGTPEEASRVWEENLETVQPITTEEERNAHRWSP